MQERKENEMKKNDLILNGIIYLVIGILLCVGVSGNDIIGWIFSGTLLVAGACLILASLIKTKAVLSSYGMTGAILITIGLALLPPIALFRSYFELISLMMIVIGVLFLLDGVLGLANKRNTVGSLIILITGAILLTFGLLLWFNVGDLRRFASLILGIVLIIYAVLLLVSGFTGKSLVGTVVVIKKK